MTHRDLVHDTVTVTATVNAALARVWEAYADTAVRARWSVPAGEALLYESDDFVSGGHAVYRCGTPGVLQFHAHVDYVLVEPQQCVVYTETLRTQQQFLATSLVTWHFGHAPQGSQVGVTCQVTSYVGQDMLDGTCNGHRIALEQLAARFEA